MSPPPNLNGRKLLLVDDDDAILELVNKILTSHGYVCDLARNGEEAFDALRRDRYHSVILDVMMPGIDGFTVSERLRKDPSYGSPYVIFLTARADHQSLGTGFQTGGVLYLTKPFTASKLLDVVKAVTEMG
jgi:DNA-binding response OmpR family regulator